MTFRIARGAQTFGPYTPSEVERYIASGNIVATDLAQADGGTEWLPVSQLFPSAVTTATPAQPATPGGLPRLFPDPPDLPWWLALLIGMVTGGIFFVAWDVVQSAWLRRVERGSLAFGLYVACAVVYLFKLPSIWHTVDYNLLGGPLVDSYIPGIGFAGIALAIAARLVFRQELLRHFNQEEPIGMRLSVIWTLLFGGLYFQYQFNRVNQIKRTLRMSVPA